MSDNQYNEHNPDFTRQPVFWQLVILMLLLIVIFSSAIVSELSEFTSVAKPPDRNSASQNAAAVVASDAVQHSKPTMKPVDVVASAAYVYDIQTDTVLFEKNAAAALPLASVTKLMTALVTHEILEEDSTIAIDLSAILQDGDSGLIGGETFEASTLNDLVLMTSSNDGAFALANSAGNELLGGAGAQAFITAMNIRAEQLGLNTLEFYNPTGLDLEDPDAPGAIGSAEDVAALMTHIVTEHNEILEATTKASDRIYNNAGNYHEAHNTNATVNQIPGLIGSKTGFTDLAGGNLAIAYDAGLNRPVVIVVLGSTRTERFTDVLTLVDAVNSSLTE